MIKYLKYNCSAWLRQKRSSVVHSAGKAVRRVGDGPTVTKVRNNMMRLEPHSFESYDQMSFAKYFLLSIKFSDIHYMNEFISVCIHRKIKSLALKLLNYGMVKYQVYTYFYYKLIRFKLTDISSKKRTFNINYFTHFYCCKWFWTIFWI